MLSIPRLHRCMQRFDNDFITLAHSSSGTASGEQRRSLDDLAGVGRPWRRQDHWAPNGCARWRTGSSLCRPAVPAHRTGWRNRARRARGHDRRARRSAAHSPRIASVRNGLPTRRRLEWPNGAVGTTFSAEDPEQLRGPQFDAAWSTNSRNGAMSTRPSTCCNSACAWDIVRASPSPPRRGRSR